MLGIKQNKIITAGLLVLVIFALILFNATAMKESQSVPVSSTRKAPVELAISTLSQKLSISRQKITIIKETSMQWRDSSLGCPQKGVQYLQVITEGLLVILQANDKTYHVHTGNNRAVICDQAMTKTRPIRRKTDNDI